MRNLQKGFLSLVICSSFSVSAFANFTQAPLPYKTNALEPAIDQQTMEIHYGKHHKAYVDNLNAQIKTYPELDKLTVEQIQKQISKYNATVRNNGGGHFNHAFFWESLAPTNKTGKVSPKLLKQITQDFGSFEAFQEQFNQAATSRFGSGWAWLIVNPAGKLEITSTPNQDNPLMDIAEKKGQPLLGLDVWEHAYYLKYQNRRADYTKAFWSVVNWNKVNQRYEHAVK
ncbi:superoxide dismutase [Acinetobacter beijerinckii]|uniref:Superoxide dismutase n=1 Tax=Acinetobacter beijerinckii CIP 110307 TaxID=1217648 RepID=N9FS05_9GAMM|nr:superoxide dismutase [Acinetobacter beijerinckii]ENW07579.1 superoxide dismutase [Mn] [Acinetobacter beijerinckii CIP 110307]